MAVSFVLPVFDLRTCSLQSVSLSSAYSCRNNLWRPSLNAFFTLSLFRATNHQGHIVNKPLLSPAVDPRLRKYTRDANIDSGETLHSSRPGCALTLAFSGSPLADVMSHVGWSSSKTAFNYLKLADVFRAGAPADLLASAPSQSQEASRIYDDYNSLKECCPCFPCVQLVFIQACSSTFIFLLSHGFL